MSSSIFLSYGRADDEPFVKRLYESLIDQGFRVWWDRVSMPNRALTFLQEVRDAIDRHDCLVLVVGPNAMQSVHVQAEWQHAREYCKPVYPVLRMGSYDLLPSELNLLDTPDFRDDTKFEQSLEHLLRHLREPVAPLGKLVDVPDLPPHFLPRLADLTALKRHVLSDVQKPVVATGTMRWTGLHGMSGIGKSVLAVALARDCEVRRAFPDGVLRCVIGQTPNLTSRQYDLSMALGRPPAYPFPDVDAGRAHLSTVLADKIGLLILDDIWRAEDARAFDVLGSRCRILLTTQNADLITALGAHKHGLDVLPEEDALFLMAGWLLPDDTLVHERSTRTAQLRDGLPETAREVAHECGYLPLALSLSAAQVRDGTPWADLLDALREADLEFFDHPHGSIMKSLKVSTDALRQTNPEHARHYSELAVFSKDTPVPEAAVLTLWLRTTTTGFNERRARQLIRILASRALIRVTGEQPNREVELHDLQYLYLRQAAQNLGALHVELVKAYQPKCSNGWHTGPNDGYFFENLAYHLRVAGRHDELYALLTESAPDRGPNPWMEAKFAACVGDTSYAADLALAISDFADPLAPHQMLVVMQLHTARQVVYERVSVYDDLALKTLVLLEREKEALSHARLRSEPFDRSSGLLTIFQILAEQGQRQLGLLRESLLAATKVQNEQRRVAALDKLATALENAHDTDIEAIIDELETVTRSIGDKEGRGSILHKLALLCDSLGERERALQIAQTIQDEMFHAIALCGLKYSIAVAEGKGFDELFTDVSQIAHSIQSPYHRVHVLSILGTVFSSVRNEYAVELFAEAEKATNSIQDENFRMNALNILATALGNAGWYDKSNAVTSGIRDRYIRARALQSISNSLVEAGQYNQAREVARSIQDEWVCVQALINLAVALIKSGDVHISDELFTEVEVIISKIPFEGQKAEALRHFAGALAEAGRYAHAEQVAYAIQDKERKIGALRELTLSLAKRGDGRAIELFSETTEAARSIQHGLQGLYQANAIRDLASLLVKTRDARAEGLFSKAIEIARGIEKGVYRADALRNLAKALAEAANEHTDEIFAEVTEVACNIPNEGARAQSLRYLAGILAEERRFDEAEATARIIQNPVNRVIALSGLGLWLAKVEDARADAILSEAENLARGISDEWARAEALSGLAVALTILGDNRGDELFTEALSLIHNLQDVIHRVTALNNLANAMAAAGSERAFEVFHEAEEVARENHQELLRDEALVGWVTITAYSGQHDRASEMLHGIQSEAHQAIALHHLATALAQAGKFSQALSVLGSCELDKYVEVLCSWGSTLETHAPDVVITILTNILRMAGWVRSDWRKVHLLLTADDRRVGA